MSVSIHSRLPIIAGKMAGKASLVVYKTAHDVEGHAKAMAPYDTGFLESGITVIPQGQLDAEVDANAEYAVYQEYGTYKMAAQPFMVPAAETSRPSFLAAMSQIV